MRGAERGCAVSRSTTKPLPANLPKLPPVPAGYTGWEYMGMGWSSGGRGVGAPWAITHPEHVNWTTRPGRMPAMGSTQWFYVRAVKRTAKASAQSEKKGTRQSRLGIYSEHLESIETRAPEPAKASAAKKTTKPERKAGRVVAKAMWASSDNANVIRPERGSFVNQERTVPVFVLPADAASVERMVEQAARAACAADGLDWSKQADPMTSGSGADDQSAYIATARAALAAIGIAATGKGARK